MWRKEETTQRSLTPHIHIALHRLLKCYLFLFFSNFIPIPCFPSLFLFLPSTSYYISLLNQITNFVSLYSTLYNVWICSSVCACAVQWKLYCVTCMYVFDSRLTCMSNNRFSISLWNESNEYGNGIQSLILCCD